MLGGRKVHGDAVEGTTGSRAIILAGTLQRVSFIFLVLFQY